MTQSNNSASSGTRLQRKESLECAGCGDGIDPRQDNHYRVNEEERPVKQLEKGTEDLTFDDFTSRGWFICPDCMAVVVDIYEVEHDG